MVFVAARGAILLARGKDALEAAADAVRARVCLCAFDLALATIDAAERVDFLTRVVARRWSTHLGNDESQRASKGPTRGGNSTIRKDGRRRRQLPLCAPNAQAQQAQQAQAKPPGRNANVRIYFAGCARYASVIGADASWVSHGEMQS